MTRSDPLRPNIALLHGRNLKRLREEHALTQEQLSELTHIPRPTIAGLETFHRKDPLTACQIYRISRALKIPTDELFSPEKP